MDKNARIYVAGHRGLVGSALMRKLTNDGYENIITRTHAELDLTNQSDTCEFFEKEKPEYVFLAAAKVGGIAANNTYSADFIYHNLMIQTNVIHESWQNNVKRLLFLGSSCIYPRDCPQPIKEEYLLTGPLESTNRPYAVAKIAGIEMCWSYNRQYGTKYLAVMPTNLFGPNDNYDLNTSHVLPALIRKMHEAKNNKDNTVTVWGTGTPKREFLYSDDMADACIYLANLSDDIFTSITGRKDTPPLMNIGCGIDNTISEVANIVKDVVGYKGDIVYDTNMPDGTRRKVLDVNMIKKIGWEIDSDLKSKIMLVYEDYKNMIGKVL